MRKLLILAAVSALAVGLFAVAPASAKTTKPVTLDGKVNVHGTKDVSSKSKASLELEADDYYFSPTFIKVKAGQKVTITVKNEGSAPHTFTSDALSVDQQVSPGKSKKLTLTVPDSPKAFEFHCNFHGNMGMRGAFYTAAGAKVTTAASSSSGSAVGY